MALIAFEDPDHPGNGPKYLTGKFCIEQGCDRPAGTAWSPLWCFEHNVERIRRINAAIDDGLAKMAEMKARGPRFGEIWARRKDA